jgi:hypothetical protein
MQGLCPSLAAVKMFLIIITIRGIGSLYASLQLFSLPGWL